MSSSPIKPLIIFLVALAGLIYAFSIGYAGILSLKSSNTMEPLLSTAVTVIGGILSTNLGAVLGVTLTPPTVKGFNPSPTFLGLRSSFQPGETGKDTNTADTSQKFQVLACWVYVGGLVVALAFWVIAKFRHIDDSAMVQLIPELVKTLFGVFVGALTVALGKNNI